MQVPSPAWKVGTGANGREDLPGVKEGLWDGNAATRPGRFREIDPGTLEQKGGLYKMMISVSEMRLTPRNHASSLTVNVAQAVVSFRPPGLPETPLTERAG